MATIFADSREQNGAIPHLKASVAENNRKYKQLAPIKYEEQQIAVGDYCIMLKSKRDPSTSFIGAVLERKTWKDLAASIKDNRMRTQHKKLVDIKKSSGCLVYFIIEGPLKYADDHIVCKMPFSGLHAKMRHETIRGFPYFQTKDPEDTAQILVRLARDLMRMYAAGDICFRDDMSEEDKQEMVRIEEQTLAIRQKYLVGGQEFTAVSGGGVKETNNTGKDDVEGSEKESAPAEIRQRKTKENIDIVADMWESLPGVTNKTSPLLMEKYKLSKIILADKDKMDDLVDEIAEMKYSSGSRLGEKRARQILKIVDGDSSEVKLASIKILSQIPGVTEATAEIIINKYSLKDIIRGNATINEIAELKKSKTRKVGNAMADNIVTLLQNYV